MAISKKRVIKSLDTLTEDLRELMRQQYPGGYEASITRITNAKKEPIFVFPLETEGAVYLIKVPATKNSDGGYDVESGKKQEFEEGNDDALPADDFDGAADSKDDYDDDGGADGAKEPGYDPDFDD
jgi:hypothetical protein